MEKEISNSEKSRMSKTQLSAYLGNPAGRDLQSRPNSNGFVIPECCNPEFIKFDIWDFIIR